MSAEILINVRPNQTRVAYIEDRVVTDLKVERKTSPTLVGSVYKGKVLRVLPGMQAAFVDIGLDRAAFLYVGDVRGDIDEEGPLLREDTDHPEEEEVPVVETGLPEAEVKDESRPLIQDLLKESQIVMVQVAKDPLGTKGARVTTHVTMPGRYLVYMPTLTHVGISRRIEGEAERERLRKIIEDLKFKGGVIVRTAGDGASSSEIHKDFEYLDLVWKEVQRNYDKRKTIGLVHAELDVELRALRDLLNADVERVIVDDAKVYRKVSSFVTQFLPQYKRRVALYKERSPLFDMYDIDLEISRSLNRKIWLKSGGYIVIDEAEALVVIDVNTGRYVGKKDLEDTILKTNLEAIKEITHQLRIRNCGGIIIIDFIDMEKEAHRHKVEAVLQEELQKDRAKTTITAMSDLGLVEMTRKRTRPSLVSSLCEPCSYCEGRGYIKRKETVASEIFRSLEREAERFGAERSGPEAPSLVVHCHGEVADWIYEAEQETLEFIEKKQNLSIVFKVEPAFHIEQFEIFTL